MVELTQAILAWVSILTGEAPSFPWERGPLGSAHPHHRSQQEAAPRGCGLRATSLGHPQSLSLRGAALPVSVLGGFTQRLASGGTSDSGSGPGQLPLGRRAELCQSQTPSLLVQAPPVAPCLCLCPKVPRAQAASLPHVSCKGLGTPWELD